MINAKKVNSVKFRLKDPEHLIEKIIRKKLAIIQMHQLFFQA